MSTPVKPVVSVVTPSGPIFDPKTGSPTFAFIKWMQNIGQTLNNAFDQQSNLLPDTIPAPTPTSLGGVQSAGPVSGQWISEIDTSGVPHLTQPSFSDLSGTASQTQIPPLSQLSGSVTAAQVPQLSQLTGKVTPSQVPDLSTLNGSVTPAQVPDLSDLNGKITEAQLPVEGLTIVVTTAKVTGGGANGSMTFTNGILTAQVQAT